MLLTSIRSALPADKWIPRYLMLVDQFNCTFPRQSLQYFSLIQLPILRQEDLLMLNKMLFATLLQAQDSFFYVHVRTQFEFSFMWNIVDKIRIKGYSHQHLVGYDHETTYSNNKQMLLVIRYFLVCIILTFTLTVDEFSFLVDYAVNNVVHNVQTSPYVTHLRSRQVRIERQHGTPPGRKKLEQYKQQNTQHRQSIIICTLEICLIVCMVFNGTSARRLLVESVKIKSVNIESIVVNCEMQKTQNVVGTIRLFGN